MSVIGLSHSAHVSFRAQTGWKGSTEFEGGGEKPRRVWNSLRSTCSFPAAEFNHSTVLQINSDRSHRTRSEYAVPEADSQAECSNQKGLETRPHGDVEPLAAASGRMPMAAACIPHIHMYIVHWIQWQTLWAASYTYNNSSVGLQEQEET